MTDQAEKLTTEELAYYAKKAHEVAKTIWAQIHAIEPFYGVVLDGGQERPKMLEFREGEPYYGGLAMHFTNTPRNRPGYRSYIVVKLHVLDLYEIEVHHHRGKKVIFEKSEEMTGSNGVYCESLIDVMDRILNNQGGF